MAKDPICGMAVDLKVAKKALLAANTSFVLENVKISLMEQHHGLEVNNSAKSFRMS